MRCLCVITSLPLGGAEKSLYRLINHSLNSVEYLVVSLDAPKEMENAFRDIGVDVINLNLKSFRNIFPAYKNFRQIIKDWEPNVIYCWMYHAMLFGTLSKIHYHKIPIIWGVRHNNLQFKYNKITTVLLGNLLGYLSKFAHAIVYCSAESLKLHTKLGYRPKMIAELIENGFDKQEFSMTSSLPSERKKDTRKKYFQNTMNDSTVVAICCRFDPLKRFDLFMEMAKEILDRDLYRVQFCLVGSGVVAERKNLLSRLPRKYEEHFHFQDQQSDIPELLTTFDVLVQCSQSESFPNIIAEAMLSEIAVVATKVGQTEIIVRDCGYLVASNDVNGLTKCVVDLIADPQLRIDLGKRARIRISEEFSINETIKRHLDLFEKIKCAD